ncbi:MAG: hypothetical protein ACNS62_01955 [Candidatus Cyclobacteriaceae bacterium M3_2C_046]
MERIVIEVSEKVAKKWRYSDPSRKQQIAEAFNKILLTLMDKPSEDFWPFLERLRAEAEKKGFNDQILDDILNE